jgi:hypothetical protein
VDPVQSGDLGIEDPRRQEREPPRPAPAPPPAPVQPVQKAAAPVDENAVKVRIYRADKVTEETFK